MNRKRYWNLVVLSALLLAGQSCKKEPVAIPPSVSEFITSTPSTFFVGGTGNQVYKLPVGVSSMANVDRSINFTVTSPTGAAAGAQYSLGKSSLTIPAGKTTDTILVNGIYSGLTASKKDTLLFTLQAGGAIPPSTFANTFRLVMQRACTVSLPALAGIYDNAIDISANDPTNPYGPYSLQITSGTTSGTTGYILVDNFGDFGSQSLRIDLDWTSSDNYKTTINDQFFFTDPNVGGIRIRSAGSGTFSPCDRKFTTKYELYGATRSYGIYTTTIDP